MFIGDAKELPEDLLEHGELKAPEEQGLLESGLAVHYLGPYKHIGSYEELKHWRHNCKLVERHNNDQGQ